MAGMKALLTLAFMGSIGMTFIILACAIYECWWPMIVLVFYGLLPIPTMIARRQNQYGGHGQPIMDFAIFFSMGLVVSSFALPIIFAGLEVPIITGRACYLTLVGNIVIYLTFIGFSMLFKDEALYNTW